MACWPLVRFNRERARFIRERAILILARGSVEQDLIYLNAIIIALLISSGSMH